MLALPTESVLLEPQTSSRVISAGACDRHHRHPLQEAETSRCQKNGIPGENGTVHRRVEDGRIRCDDLRERSQCPRVSKKTSPCRQPHSGDGQTIRESPLLPGNSRGGGLLSLLPRPANVPQTHSSGRKSARRGCRGRRGIRGLLQREISTSVQQADQRHSAWKKVPQLCGGRGETTRDHHVRNIRTVLILELSRQRCLNIGVYLLWLVTCHFKPGETLTIQRGDIQILIQGFSSRHRVCLYPRDRPLKSKRHAANNTVELYCAWCESLPLTAAAFSHGKPHTTSNINFHDF